MNKTCIVAHATACLVLQELTAAACYKILSQISDEDCRALGFDTRYTRPDWMLVSVLPVPPPPVRPSVMMDSSARCVLPCAVVGVRSCISGSAPGACVLGTAQVQPSNSAC